MEVIITIQAERELKNAPKDILVDVFALFDDLAAGKKLSMPICRPLYSIYKGLYELRLSSRSGEYRIFYILSAPDAIYVLLAMSKKKQKLDHRVVDLLKQRIRRTLL